MKLAKEEVAKRLANATNKSGEQKKAESPGSSKNQTKDFKVGDFCRATYEDGVDYEAKIIAVDSNGKFLIRYIGYENEDYKEKSELLATWGKKVRKVQKFEAQQASNVEEGSESGVSMDAEFGGQVLFERPKPGTKAQVKAGTSKSGASVIFPPPPPMPPMIDENLEDAEHLSAMLMSWYMSGYYTGLYQGQKMAQQKRKGHWKIMQDDLPRPSVDLFKTKFKPRVVFK